MEVPLETKVLKSKNKSFRILFLPLALFLCFCLIPLYIVPIFLILTIIGFPVAVLMFVGIAGIQSALIYAGLPGIKYKIECPVCQNKMQIFKLRSHRGDLTLKCSSCKKDLIIRGDKVLHFK